MTRNPLLVFAVCLTVAASARADGPDVIVADLPSTTDYNRDGTHAALSVGTTSCNVGTELLNWFALPSNQHPVIAQNLYILEPNGRLEQIGASWVKHGFAAINNGICGTCDGNTGQVLGIHCSDPYGTGLNSGPGLGARIEINPTTGFYDGATADDHGSHGGHTATAHGCRVLHSRLGVGGAQYYIEGHYITADDALAGNGNNNASYRELGVSGNSSNWTFTNLGPTVQEQPAIKVWPGATQVEIDNGLDDGLIHVAYRTVDLGGGNWRYEYNIHNHSSARAIRSLSIPTGSANISNIGFNGTFNHDEGYSEDPSNTPWSSSVSNGNITWSTDTFATNAMANAIRWGTMYTFWFDADVAPTGSIASLGRFAPGPGSNTLLAQVAAPQAGDCNNNQITDDIEIAGDPGLDCNNNGFLDECELDGNDCNGNSLPDDCDLAGNDCNSNNVPDECDLAGNDCNGNTIPDDCETLSDCNNNGTADVCELAGNDCDNNMIPDDCDPDCDFDGTPDACAGEPDCNDNGIPDSCDVNGVAGGIVDYDSGTIDIPVPSSGTSGSQSHTVNSATAGTIIDVDVRVNMSHTWVGDLDISLEHLGTTVLLFNHHGLNGQNFDDTVFDDEAASAIGSGSPPYSGSYIPDSALSAFDGMPIAGDWTLLINDTAGGDSGVLHDWTVTVEGPTNPPTSDDDNMNGVPDECETTCASACPGDTDLDGKRDGADIQMFVDAYVGGYDACADMDSSGAPLTMQDLNDFTNALVTSSCP